MIPRLFHTALAIVVFTAATLPCGFGVPAADRIDVVEIALAVEAEDDETTHATSDAMDMPCHAPDPEPPPHELTQPCLCGCADQPAGRASVSRLPVAVLPTELEPASPVRAPLPPLPRFEAGAGYPSPPDVVPWV